jgi:RNA polymerase sigma-70 factor (ECF subfamily)|tara:strand:+ start:115 stop:624 length:510 start_codon:yes stop_codon:yes gene_type:complete
MSDPKAFYDKHKTLVYNLALNYCGNKEDAEEITQDVFLTVFKKMSIFRHESKIETWIYRVAINKSLDYLKAKKRFKRNFINDGVFIDQVSQTEFSDFNHPGVLLESKEKIQEIYSCINKLPEDYRTVIILLKIENRTYKEVSEIMKISIKAVESLFNRAKKKLDALLKK